MSAFSGTPGPWFANHHSRGSCEVKITRPVGSSGMGPVAYALMDLAGAMTDERIAEMKANARLIAAAPDSHEANVKFIEAIECLCNVTAGWTDDRIYDELPSSGLAIAYFAARAAIAKATGGGS